MLAIYCIAGCVTGESDFSKCIAILSYISQDKINVFLFVQILNSHVLD